MSRKRSKAARQVDVPPAAAANSLPAPRTVSAPPISASGLLGANRQWGEQLRRHYQDAASSR